MGIGQSKKEINGEKPRTLNIREVGEKKIDQTAIMPSIEQCDSGTASLTALPSTLEIFDKYKSVSENGKDSDSEESFHLPLDDDDMENQSVVSNGRDKEETEDDILNKFETVPSGTPDHIDPHVEDSILDDVENLTGKDGDISIVEQTAKGTQDSTTKKGISKSTKGQNSCKPKETSSSNSTKDQDSCKPKKNLNQVEVKLTYNFDEYEDSGDGEFKSVYETDECAAQLTNEEIKLESTEAPENEEPMEIGEENASLENDKEENKDKNLDENLDNYEDSMEVEQEETNQDIANIIEKLEDPDTPMDDAKTLASNDGDVNMAESCAKAEANEITTNVDSDCEKPFLEKAVEEVKSLESDVDMVEHIQNEILQETAKENIDEIGDSDSATNLMTFQESMETPKDAPEESSGDTEAQTSVNEEENVVNKEEAVEDVEEKKNQTTVEHKDETPNNDGEDENKKVDLSDEESNKTTEKADKTSNVMVTDKSDGLENDQEENVFVSNPDTDNNSDGESNKTGEKEDSKSNEMVTDKSDCLEDDQKENVVVSNLETDNISDPADIACNTQNDDLLKELDETINESEKEKKELTKTQSSTDNAKSESTSLNDADVFKVPEEILKTSEELSTQKEDKDGPDLQNEKSNDKSDEDESDLLDVSMIRETHEDDACAIADALIDKDALISEKSDEEQSEKVETEQEGSDNDKDIEDNDNEPIDYDDTDEDSRMDSADHDESSNAESVKDKMNNVFDSLKNDTENDLKNVVKALEFDSDVSTDVIDKTFESKNSEPLKKMNVLENLDSSTAIQNDAVLSTEEDLSSSTNLDKEEDIANKEILVKKKIAETDISETEKDSEIAKEPSESLTEVNKESGAELLDKTLKLNKDDSARRKSLNKRTFSATENNDIETAAKKKKITTVTDTETENQKETVEKPSAVSQKPPETDSAQVNEKVKTLSAFSNFMQCRKLTAKLSRSDLEQFCIQKICECLMLKSSEGELHQANKKHEKIIEILRKDLQQLTKQCKDLEIVNKKLMNELKTQNAQKKPLVPLKITRSVGLQVRLNPGNETPNQNRRRQPTTGTTTPQKPTANTVTPTTRVKVTTGNVQQPTVVRQVLQTSPQKSPLTTGQTTTNTTTTTNALLSQALQQTKPRPAQTVAAKRTATPVRKTPEVSKPSNPGVIDLTDEDDRLAATKTVGGGTIKILNKSQTNTPNKTVTLGKLIPGKTVTNQGKQVGVQKTVTVGQNKGNTLSQGIRLTPASVITSSANGSPQMVYVVPTITSNAGGTQKVAFVNFQPSNGVISGALNGSIVSNKGQTFSLKTVSSQMRVKHPAALPSPPRGNLDPKLKPLLPKPHLTIKKIDTGIILQWKMPYNLDSYESIASYQLYAYQETSAPPSTDMWRKVGDVKALALPMACTLTQFADKNKYYFAVRSVDVHKRIGAFSEPEEISL